MNDNLLKVISILVGLAAGFFIVPLLAGFVMLIMQVFVGILISIVIYTAIKKKKYKK